MGERRVLAEEHEGAPSHAELPMRLHAESGHLLLGHALPERGEDGAVGLHRDLADPPQDRDLVGVLDHPASRGHLCAVLEAGGGRRLRHRVGEGEGHGLVHSHSSRPHLAVAQDVRHELGGRLVFLPRAHVGADLDLLERALLLEGGRHPRGVALASEDGAEEALGKPPERPREVLEGAAGRHHQRVDAGLAHQGLGPQQAGLPLVDADRRDALGLGLEGAHGRGQLFGWGVCSRGEGRAQGGRRGDPEELAPGNGRTIHSGTSRNAAGRMLPSVVEWRSSPAGFPPFSFFFSCWARRRTPRTSRRATASGRSRASG